MSAPTQTVSPTTRFTAYLPPSTSGVTHSIVRCSRPRVGTRRSRFVTEEGLGAKGYGFGNKDVVTADGRPRAPISVHRWVRSGSRSNNDATTPQDNSVGTE